MAKYIRQIIIIIIEKKKMGHCRPDSESFKERNYEKFFLNDGKIWCAMSLMIQCEIKNGQKMTMIWEDKISSGARMTDVKIKNSKMAVQR
jgi:hypothetical protein